MVEHIPAMDSYLGDPFFLASSTENLGRDASGGGGSICCWFKMHMHIGTAAADLLFDSWIITKAGRKDTKMKR